MIDLDALEALAKAATPKGWTPEKCSCGHPACDKWRIQEWPAVNLPKGDVDLIVAARNALPELIAEVRRLRQLLTEAKDEK